MQGNTSSRSSSNENIKPFFNKENARNTMKAMLTCATQKVTPKGPTNSIEVRNSKIAELDKMNKAERKQLELYNNTLHKVAKENDDGSRLKEYYRNILIEKKKLIAKLLEEGRVEQAKHEMGMKEAQKELEMNLKDINQIRDHLIKKDGENKTKQVK
jgi:hypothetical protein